MESSVRVLVVEDELLVARDIQQQLRKHGYEALDPTSSGRDAIRRAAADEPDLVLMDIMLKGAMDGIDAAKEIQRLNIPVVFVTAHTDQRTLRRAKQAYPYGYVRKPFDGGELRAAIEVAVHKHRAEVERNRAEAERRQRVEQAREFEHLQELERFKTEFLNMAAHELRTPLAPMLWELEILRRTLTDLPPRAARSLEILTSCFARLSQIVEEILDGARMQAGHLGVARQPVDLEPVVREAVDAVRSLASTRRLSIQVEMIDRAYVLGDSRRIHQVLANMLTNAIKYTPPEGGVTLTVRRQGDAVETRVRDTGIGFAPGDAMKLFHPFTRLAEVDAGPWPGAGLGLYISKGFVELMGGRIGCESEGPGHGAAFFFTLPAAVPDAG